MIVLVLSLGNHFGDDAHVAGGAIRKRVVNSVVSGIVKNTIKSLCANRGGQTKYNHSVELKNPLV